jgi:hypothetical protein
VSNVKNCPMLPESHSRRRRLNLRVAKLLVVAVIGLGGGTIVLVGYAVAITAQAKALLKDLTSLKVGISTEADVQQFVRRHRRYVLSEYHDNHTSSTAFEIRNSWLSALKIEPQAWFSASVAVQDGSVRQIGASLFRSMDIFPTFQASAGMVVENAGKHHLSTPSAHYYFRTPVGKPYLRVELDSQASPVQRQRAFDFSFRCLTKPGGGCDLPCDYLPSAWQDWKESLRGSGLYPGYFYERYPKSTRCKPG